ncbi:hypothetical protein HN937_13870, partial [Candidatus Poribacteria bacterium]|nr:hypothetical protein [Candidatus Poribacteria bacterium]
MMRCAKATIAVACALLSAIAGEAGACKYSVRDVAFVDILPDPYHVYIHVGADTSAETRADIAA